MGRINLILGIVAIALLLFFCGCVEQKKYVTLTMADEIYTPVNSLPILLSAKFNESINGSVLFYINDQFIGEVYFNGTEVFMYYYENLSAGEYKVRAVFPGNDKYNNASASTILKIVRHYTTLNIELEPDGKIYFNDILTVKTTLNIPGMANCTNKEIYLFVNEKFFSKNLTNDECAAEFTLKNLNVGKINVQVEYKGSEIYENATAIKNIDVVSKIPIEIFAESKDVEVKDKYVTIYADIKDYMGRNVSDWTLKLIFRGRHIGNLTARNNTFVLDISNWKLGDYRLQLVFDGNETYENNSKDVFIGIIEKYNISGVEVITKIPLKEIIYKDIMIYVDGSTLSDYCAYALEPIVDQKRGYEIYIMEGDKNSIFLSRGGGTITIKHESYEMLPCHVFLCINRNINCSILEVIEALGQLENLSIALDENIRERKVFEVYNEILLALGYIQGYLISQGKEIYIKKYIIRNDKCEFVPTKTMYQNLTEKEINNCDFKGIFIKKGKNRLLRVDNGKIFLEGDETGLFIAGTILKWLIAPGYMYELRVQNS